MKIIKRILVSPFVFGILLVTHLFFVFKRTYKFIRGGGELTLNEESKLPNNETLKLMEIINNAESKADGHFKTIMDYMHLCEDLVGFAGPIENVREELKIKGALKTEA